ncbi:MAG: phosphotransferase [Deltaproteobacteria bacterium]|nr:phosphotransferase [Deltaproteobacteria bacterium]
MAKRFIPKSAEEITPEWLTGALTESGVLSGNSVRAIKREVIGSEQGYMGILTRLSIEYDQPDDAAPSTMVAKIPTQEPKNKMIMEAFWNFERENRLYEEILDQLPLRTPRCYYSDFDPGKGEKWVNSVYKRYGKLPKGLAGLYFYYVGMRNLRLKRRYILLLEDFGGLEQIDQRDGCSLEDAKLVMKPLGIAHAAFWESPQLNKYWLKDHADFSNMMGFLASRGIPVLKKAFPEKLSQKENEVFDWLMKNNANLAEYTKTRPNTLIHTDYRLDNIFFDRVNNNVAVIDWQASCPGLGLFDPCFFILNNGSSPFTHDQAEELITIYHQGLVEGGLSDYSLEECMSDYKYGLLIALRYVLIIIGGIEVEKDPNAKALLGLWLDRMKPLIEGIDLSILFKERDKI